MELERVYHDVYPKLFAFFFARTSSREVSDDLTQEVFYEAIKGAGKFRGQSSVRTWLFGIAKNKLNRYYRSKRSASDLEQALVWGQQERHDGGPEDQAIQNETQRMLTERIHRLDEPAKEVVLLRIYGELSFKEIGELVGISENHARVIFHRTKIQLQREMGEKNG